MQLILRRKSRPSQVVERWEGEPPAGSVVLAAAIIRERVKAKNLGSASDYELVCADGHRGAERVYPGS